MTIEEIIQMYIDKGWKAEMIHKHLKASGYKVLRKYVRELVKRRKETEAKDKIIVQISEKIHAESHPKDIRIALIEVKLKDYGV